MAITKFPVKDKRHVIHVLKRSPQENYEIL